MSFCRTALIAGAILFLSSAPVRADDDDEDELMPPETAAPAPPVSPRKEKAIQAEEWTRIARPERAEKPPGAHTFLIASSFFQFDFQEELQAPLKSSERGFLIGSAASYQYDFPDRPLFFRTTLELVASGLTYDGTTTAGAPIVAPSKSFLLDTDVEIGVTVLEPSPGLRARLFCGVGYRLWRRGPNEYAGSYREEYTWLYFPLGMRWDVAVSENVSVGLEASARFPVGGKLRVFLSNYDARLQDVTTLIESRTGGKVELPITFRVPFAKRVRLKVIVTPFLEYLAIGRSPDFPVLTTTGALAGFAHEPNSRTYQYGTRLSTTVEF